MDREYILYLDTSEPVATIAIYKAQTTVKKCCWEAGRGLSATLSGQYTKILKEARVLQDHLGGIVVFVGPGSFTGLRIGISFANAMAFSLGIPIYETKQKEKFILTNPKEIALPFYGSEPKITKPKK